MKDISTDMLFYPLVYQPCVCLICLSDTAIGNADYLASWDNLTVRGPHKTYLTHWGRVMHIYVSKLSITGSVNGLSPGRRQAIIWTNDGILIIRTLGTNLSETLSEIHIFSVKKMHLKMLPVKWLSCCLSLNVLTHWGWDKVVLNENWSILFQISLKVAPKGSIGNTSALVLIMACGQTGDKSKSEPMMA